MPVNTVVFINPRWGLLRASRIVRVKGTVFQGIEFAEDFQHQLQDLQVPRYTLVVDN